MAMELKISTLRDDADLGALGAIAMQAFPFPADRVKPYYESGGKQNVRIARAGEEIAGGLLLLPMGQHFGPAGNAQAIGMTGIAAVAVAPEHRSQGVGRFLMQSILEELHDAGVPLSALYPATLPVYRKAGYEIAGYFCDTRVAIGVINVKEPSVEVRAMTADDVAAVRAIYGTWAAQTPGSLQRSEFIWSRVGEYHGIKRRGYVLTHGGSIEGYFYCGQRPEARALDVGDYVITTPGAGRRFWQFFGDHRSVAERVYCLAPVEDPLLLLLREHTWEVGARGTWMLRIIRPAEALGQRGYPAEMKGELQIELVDEVLPQNSGIYELSVENGRGTVRRSAGGSGALTVGMTIGALAPLYSGLWSGQQLAAMGIIRGSGEAIALASSIFAAPPPWMRDPF